MIRSAETLDPHLWAECLSSSDRTHYEATVSLSYQRHLEQSKQQYEVRLGRPMGEDIFEFAQFYIVLEGAGRTGIPPQSAAMAHILEEVVWDDSYAEVTLILPLPVKGYLAPLRYCFLKENGEWRFCQWLTTELTMGWGKDVGRRLDAAVNILLKIHAGIDFDRGNCAGVRQTTYPVPESVSAAYARALDGSTSPYGRKQYLLPWALTGDKEAERRIAEEDAKVPTAGIANEVARFKQYAALVKPCSPQPTDPSEKSIPPDSAEFWFRVLDRDMIGLQALLKRFPEDRKWCMKAQMRIAAHQLRREAYAEAAAEYETALRLYPEFPDETVEAKTRLAGLCWRNLNRKEEAQRLWRELEAIGKVPPDAALGDRPLAITTLLKEPGGAWMNGIADFDLAPDDSLVVLRLESQPVKEKSQGKASTLCRLNHHDATGTFQKTLVQERVTETNTRDQFKGLQHSDGKYYVQTADAYRGFFIFDAEGKFNGELARRGDRFQVTTERSTEASTDHHWETWPRALFAWEGTIAILTLDKVRFFNDRGDPLREIAVPSCDASDSYRLTGNNKGDLAFIQPKEGKAFILDRSGKLVPIKYPGTPEGRISQLRHLFTDQAGNIYCVDQPTRKVIKFDSSGKFVRSLSHESIVEPTSATVDEQGNVYVIGYGALAGGSIATVLDAEGRFQRAVEIAKNREGALHGNILDIEISQGDIYAVVNQSVIRCDRDGNLLSKYTSEGRNSGLTLIKDGAGRIYFTTDGQIFRYEAEASRPMPLPAEATAAGTTGRSGLRVLGFDRNGILVGADVTQNPVRVDLATGTVKGYKTSSGRRLFGGWTAVDAAGTIFTTGDSGREIRAIAPDGSESLLAKAELRAKSFWFPNDLFFDRKDSIYVYDGANKSLFKFKADGSFVAETSLATQIPGNVHRLRLDAQNRLLALVEASDTKSIIRLDLEAIFGGGDR